MKTRALKILICFLSAICSFSLLIVGVFANANTSINANSSIGFIRSPYALAVPTNAVGNGQNVATVVLNGDNLVLHDLFFNIVGDKIEITHIMDNPKNPLDIVFIPAQIKIGDKALAVTKILSGALSQKFAPSDIFFPYTLREISENQFVSNFSNLKRVFFLGDKPPNIKKGSLPSAENSALFNVFVKSNAINSFVLAIKEGNSYWRNFEFLISQTATNPDKQNFPPLFNDYGLAQTKLAAIEDNSKTYLFDFIYYKYIT